MAMSRATAIPMHTFTLNDSHARTRCMNSEMKKLRKKLLHGERGISPSRKDLVAAAPNGCVVGVGGSRRLRPQVSAVEPLFWHERLAKLANRASLR